MAVMVDFVVDADGNTYWIELGIDTGTGYHTVFGVVMKNSKQMRPPILLKIQGQPMVSAVMAWHNEQFRWGDMLLNDVDNGKVPAHAVMQCTKLALYEGFAAQGTSDIKDRVMDQHAEARVSVQQTYTAFYTSLFAAARDSICMTEYAHFFDKQGLEFLRNLPIRARIAMPHSFGPCAGRILRQAVTAGGASSVNLTSEQICVLAAYIETLPGEVLALMTEPFILVDAGCGTIDSVKYIHSGGEGTRSRFKAISQSSGSLSGSQKVNRLIQKMVEDRVPGGMQLVYDRLGMNRNEFNFEMLERIEIAKKSFNLYHLNKPIEFALTNISITNYVTQEEFRSRVTPKMVEAASNTVFAEFIPSIDDLFKLDRPTTKGKPRFIILCGGYGQSAYMLHQFEQHYKGENAKVIQMSGDAILVAMGALSSRFSSIDVQKLPLRFGYAIVQDMVFDFELHPDCWKLDKADRRRVNPRKAKRLVVGSPLDHRTVLSRLLFIARKGERPDQMTPVYQVFRPFVDDPVVTIMLVCTEGNYKDNDAALDDDHDVTFPDNKLRGDIRIWTNESWTLDKKLMQSGLWEIAVGEDTGNPRYMDVWIEIGIHCTEEQNMSVEIKIILPDMKTKKSDKDGKTVKVEGVVNLWDPRGPDLLSDEDAGSGPPLGDGDLGDMKMEEGLA